MNAQPELQLRLDIKKEDCKFMVDLLRGNGWMTAAQILKLIGHDPASESAKRSLRAVADASQGAICGGQRGYALTEELTKEEFNHSRNFFLAQAGAMQRRVLEMDKVFFGRQSVPK